MDSNKMKTVKKIVIKNILAWVCILCLVLCAMPLGVSAEGDDEGAGGELTGSVVGNVDGEDVDQGDGNTEDTPVEERTITVMLTLNSAGWAEADVALLGGAVYVTGKTDTDGSCVLTVPKDAPSLVLYVNNKATTMQAVAATEKLQADFFEVEFFDGEEQYDTLTQIGLSGFRASKPEDPKKTGYSFAGWKDAKEDGSDFDFSTVINKETKLYASWTESQPGTHTHTWDEAWGANDSYHWHICTADDCPVDWTVTENIQDNAKDYETHTYGEFEVVTPATCSTEGLEKRTCEVCGHEFERVIEKLAHTFEEDEWETDEDNHWHICTVCDEKVDEGAHVEKRTVTTRPTTTEEGECTYSCRVCGKELRTEVIPVLGPDHEHEYDGEWTYDGDDHWKECICGEPGEKGEHTWDEGTVIKEATANSDGTMLYECTVCGMTRTERIPKKSGIVEKGTERGNNTPQIEVATEVKELAELVLTEEEKEAMRDGADVRFTLAVENIGGKVSPQDQTAISQILGAYQVGQYLDINLYKEVDHAGRNRIAETSSKIRITINVPASLYNMDNSRTRSFAIVRVHDGKATILNDLDNNPNTITLETDRFSTYAIVYRDVANNTGDQGNNGNNTTEDTGNNGNNGNTGNNTGNTGTTEDNNGSSTTESSNGNTTVNNYTINNTTYSSSTNTVAADKSKGTPKTGDAMAVNLYATLAMISGLGSIFYGRQGRMTEKDKEELIAAVSRKAKNGGITAKCFAVFAIASILLYYHTIGKRGKVNVK